MHGIMYIIELFIFTFSSRQTLDALIIIINLQQFVPCLLARESYQYNEYHWSNEAEDEVVVRP